MGSGRLKFGAQAASFRGGKEHISVIVLLSLCCDVIEYSMIAAERGMLDLDTRVVQKHKLNASDLVAPVTDEISMLRTSEANAKISEATIMHSEASPGPQRRN
jgi:hypothetical protein